MAVKSPIVELTTEAAVEQKIAEVRKDRAAAFKTKSAWTAVATLHRLESDLLSRLAELRAPKPEAGANDDLSADELADVLISAIPGLADPVIDRLAEAIAARRGGRHLRAVG